MKEFVNPFTGEILPFATRFSAVPDKAEHYEAGTSMTDVTQYEPLQSLIGRIVRGTVIPRTDIYYDEHEDVTAAPGFDLVDAGEIMLGVQDELSSAGSAKQKDAGKPASDSPATSPADVKQDVVETSQIETQA